MAFDRRRGRQGPRTENYIVADIIQTLESLEGVIESREGQRALDAVAAAFGLRRVPQYEDVSLSRQVVIEQVAPRLLLGRQ